MLILTPAMVEVLLLALCFNIAWLLQQFLFCVETFSATMQFAMTKASVVQPQLTKLVGIMHECSDSQAVG